MQQDLLEEFSDVGDEQGRIVVYHDVLVDPLSPQNLHGFPIILAGLQ